MTIADLPAVNACLNSLCTVLLLSGWRFIKQGKKTAHRHCMIAALATSALFLTSYLTYHFNTAAVTRFTEPAWFRPIYLVILLTHLIGAFAIVPLVLMTVSRAVKQRFELHKKIARWTLPIWLYVSVTGVVIYLLLYQIYPQGR